MGMKKYFQIYSYHGGGIRGLKRVCDTFSQIDFFDFKRSFINTRENVRDGYSTSDYMFYAPVYTNVLKEMIYVAHDYWASAVRYTDYGAKSFFVDLGCGSGKTLISACESKKFERIFGIELLPKLATRGSQNIEKTLPTSGEGKPMILNMNVEDPSWANQIISKTSN